MANLQQMSQAELIAAYEAMQAKLAKATAPRKLTLKVTDKGAVSLYGLGRFPVTLYQSQWARVIDGIGEIKDFIEANADRLATKD